MLVIGIKQRIATGLSIAVGAPRQLGLVKGTLGASKVIARLFNGSVTATVGTPAVYPSWDGVAPLGASVAGLFTVTVESRDVELVPEAEGLVMEVRPVGERFFSFPSLALVVTPSATTLITVDAWVLYDVEHDAWLKRSSTNQMLFPT